MDVTSCSIESANQTGAVLAATMSSGENNESAGGEKNQAGSQDSGVTMEAGTMESSGDSGTNPEERPLLPREIVGQETESEDNHKGTNDEKTENTTNNNTTKEPLSVNGETATDKIDLEKPPDLEGDGRNKMFEKGLKLEKEGQKDAALKCYLTCLIDLKQETNFPLLPQCLRNIGDIYYEKGDYWHHLVEQYRTVTRDLVFPMDDKAVQFIQAEKLYYESVLIDTSELQTQIDDAKKNAEENETDLNIDELRATEYDNLAKLCLDNSQPQLALEYAGKATKIRQQLYGDSHTMTQESLDFFASIYAEVGKQQYSESMQKFTSRHQCEQCESSDENLSDEEAVEDTTSKAQENTDMSTSEPPVSILRKRKNTEGDKEKKVRFDETQLPPEDVSQQDEERCARVFLWVLLFLCIVVLVMLGTYLFCHDRVGHSGFCHWLKGEVLYRYMRLKYWIYQHTGDPNVKYG